jgi:hypothetical protein
MDKYVGSSFTVCVVGAAWGEREILSEAGTSAACPTDCKDPSVRLLEQDQAIHAFFSHSATEAWLSNCKQHRHTSKSTILSLAQRFAHTVQ